MDFLRRCQRIYQIGCIACRKRGWRQQQCQVHHLNLGGHAGQLRRGDEFTIGLCPWHHVGELVNGVHYIACLHAFGPSLKLHARQFRNTFGSDDDLLRYQNMLIAEAETAVVGRQAGASP